MRAALEMAVRLGAGKGEGGKGKERRTKSEGQTAKGS
jgi:hypothetical protein